LIVDNRLTQRLVGAAVVAALAVIFVPELLERSEPLPVERAASGQSEPPARNNPETTTLTFSQPQPHSTATDASPAVDRASTTPAEPVATGSDPIDASQEEAARLQAAQDARDTAEAERIAAARARAEATQRTAEAETAQTRARAEAARAAAARAETARREAARTAPAPNVTTATPAARTEANRATEAARREAARAETARRAAQAEAARKTAQAEAARQEIARAEAARRTAQTTARRAESPRPAAPLPKLELIARSEAPATSVPRPASPPPRPQPAAAPADASRVVGSFALQENAFTLRDQFRSQNVRAAVERIVVNDRPMYQVRVWR
jgi:cell division septation protein DedD